MNEKFCPLLTTTEKRIVCQREKCILFNEEECICELKIREKNRISVSDGFKIAIGISLWIALLSWIIFVIIAIKLII